jgi:hypothetical protein
VGWIKTFTTGLTLAYSSGFLANSTRGIGNERANEGVTLKKEITNLIFVANAGGS